MRLSNESENKKLCTWTRANSFSRIDYFFISNNLTNYKNSSKILPSILSDHKIITLNLEIIDNEDRGCSFWKLNSSYLLDTEYKKLIVNAIDETTETFKNINDKSLLWELIKSRVRTESIQYGIKRKKTKM